MVGRKTEKTRFKRSVKKINEILRVHYNYYGMGGNKSALIKFYIAVKMFWWKMLCGRSWEGYVTWERFNKIKKEFPMLRPRIRIPMEKIKSYTML